MARMFGCAMLSLTAFLIQNGGIHAASCTASPDECPTSIRNQLQDWLRTCQTEKEDGASRHSLKDRQCAPCVYGSGNVQKNWRLWDPSLDVQILHRTSSYLHQSWAHQADNLSTVCDGCSPNYSHNGCDAYCDRRNDAALDIAYKNATSWSIYGAALQACVDLTDEQPSCLSNEDLCQLWSPACRSKEVVYWNCHRRTAGMILRWQMESPCVAHEFGHRMCAFNDAEGVTLDTLDRMIQQAVEVINKTEPPAPPAPSPSGNCDRKCFLSCGSVCGNGCYDKCRSTNKTCSYCQHEDVVV